MSVSYECERQMPDLLTMKSAVMPLNGPNVPANENLFTFPYKPIYTVFLKYLSPNY